MLTINESTLVVLLPAEIARRHPPPWRSHRSLFFVGLLLTPPHHVRATAVPGTVCHISSCLVTVVVNRLSPHLQWSGFRNWKSFLVPYSVFVGNVYDKIMCFRQKMIEFALHYVLIDRLSTILYSRKSKACRCFRAYR